MVAYEANQILSNDHAKCIPQIMFFLLLFYWCNCTRLAYYYTDILYRGFIYAPNHI